MAALKEAKPQEVGKILEDIQGISDEAKRVLAGTTSRSEQVEVLSVRFSTTSWFRQRMRDIAQRLVAKNHALLNDFDVSHPALEIIVAKTASAPYHLPTKLTGAGGGGCAVTLIPDSASASPSLGSGLDVCTGFSPALLLELKSELENAGFSTYETSVGGSGVGIALPSPTQRAAPAEGGVEAQIVPERAGLSAASANELAGWAQSAAERWLFA